MSRRGRLLANIYSNTKIEIFLRSKPWKGKHRVQQMQKYSILDARRPRWSMLKCVPSTSMQIVGVCVLICLANLPKTLCDETAPNQSQIHSGDENYIRHKDWSAGCYCQFHNILKNLIISRFPKTSLLECLFSNIIYIETVYLCVHCIQINFVRI